MIVFGIFKHFLLPILPHYGDNLFSYRSYVYKHDSLYDKHEHIRLISLSFGNFAVPLHNLLSNQCHYLSYKELQKSMEGLKFSPRNTIIMQSTAL